MRKFIHSILTVLCCIFLTAAESRDEPFVLGADISWIPERESYDVRYADNGVEKDIVEILKEHRFNWIRLRLFVDPTNSIPNEPESPYSAQGFCNLEHTLQMARRIKEAGFKFLLDFHYSDTWADPGKQYKPLSWEGLSFEQLKDKVRSYTRETLEQFEAQSLLPDMVQVGNEVVGGMIWPDGRLGNLENFASLVNAGIDGVRDVDPDIKIMIHSISENSPAWWLSNLVNAGVSRIDVFGLSYYSQWHGTPDDLERMVNEIADNHTVKIAIAEYADNHERVNEIIYNLPDQQGLGTFVWEPADWMEALFDWRNGRRETNERIDLYPRLSAEYGNDEVGVQNNGRELSVYSKDLQNSPTINSNGTLHYISRSAAPKTISLITGRGRTAARWNISGPGSYALSLAEAGTPTVGSGFFMVLIEDGNRKWSIHKTAFLR